MHPAGVAILVILFLAIGAGIGWIVFTRLRAQRLGLPAPPLSSYIPFLKSSSSSPYGPPQPAPGGVVGWFNDRLRAFKNRNNRTAAGAYEQSGTTGGPPRHRGFGPLDPDEAWDSRVGHEADPYAGPGGYYEEQELGLRTPNIQGGDTSYGGSSYQMNLATDPRTYGEERGRPRSRSPGGVPANPFADSAEPSNLSMRGVSPRPIDTGVARGKGKDEDSPTERKSVFRENV
ncbi:hypothetical protein B0T16DRAFT_457670 [Cercophora newfieldiana]|uniref:Acid phosphatase-like protein n=1 Tax=Cercophora newfieldiana TaxID=92897 RepID=A0AA39Y435_9PEZI|nr:hypothetical protein B0T16DRAFT_457670 [Cercophora newfieldiana]